MTLVEYTFLALSSLFVIIDPIAVVPAFIAMTPTDPPKSKLRMARIACFVAAGVLIVFAGAGKWIFKFMGITLPAFQLAGSILLLRIALDMLSGRRSEARETDEEVAAAGAGARSGRRPHPLARHAPGQRRGPGRKSRPTLRPGRPHQRTVPGRGAGRRGASGRWLAREAKYTTGEIVRVDGGRWLA